MSLYASNEFKEIEMAAGADYMDEEKEEPLNPSVNPGTSDVAMSESSAPTRVDYTIRDIFSNAYKKLDNQSDEDYMKEVDDAIERACSNTCDAADVPEVLHEDAQTGTDFATNGVWNSDTSETPQSTPSEQELVFAIHKNRLNRLRFTSSGRNTMDDSIEDDAALLLEQYDRSEEKQAYLKQCEHYLMLAFGGHGERITLETSIKTLSHDEFYWLMYLSALIRTMRFGRKASPSFKLPPYLEEDLKYRLRYPSVSAASSSKRTHSEICKRPNGSILWCKITSDTTGRVFYVPVRTRTLTAGAEAANECAVDAGDDAEPAEGEESAACTKRLAGTLPRKIKKIKPSERNDADYISKLQLVVLSVPQCTTWHCESMFNRWMRDPMLDSPRAIAYSDKIKVDTATPLPPPLSNMYQFLEKKEGGKVVKYELIRSGDKVVTDVGMFGNDEDKANHFSRSYRNMCPAAIPMLPQLHTALQFPAAVDSRHPVSGDRSGRIKVTDKETNTVSKKRSQDRSDESLTVADYTLSRPAWSPFEHDLNLEWNGSLPQAFLEFKVLDAINPYGYEFPQDNVIANSAIGNGIAKSNPNVEIVVVRTRQSGRPQEFELVPHLGTSFLVPEISTVDSKSWNSFESNFVAKKWMSLIYDHWAELQNSEEEDNYTSVYRPSIGVVQKWAETRAKIGDKNRLHFQQKLHDMSLKARRLYHSPREDFASDIRVHPKVNEERRRLVRPLGMYCDVLNGMNDYGPRFPQVPLLKDDTNHYNLFYEAISLIDGLILPPDVRDAGQHKSYKNMLGHGTTRMKREDTNKQLKGNAYNAAVEHAFNDAKIRAAIPNSTFIERDNDDLIKAAKLHGDLRWLSPLTLRNSMQQYLARHFDTFASGFQLRTSLLERLCELDEDLKDTKALCDNGTEDTTFGKTCRPVVNHPGGIFFSVRVDTGGGPGKGGYDSLFPVEIDAGFPDLVGPNASHPVRGLHQMWRPQKRDFEYPEEETSSKSTRRTLNDVRRGQNDLAEKMNTAYSDFVKTKLNSSTETAIETPILCDETCGPPFWWMREYRTTSTNHPGQTENSHFIPASLVSNLSKYRGPPYARIQNGELYRMAFDYVCAERPNVAKSEKAKSEKSGGDTLPYSEKKGNLTTIGLSKRVFEKDFNDKNDMQQVVYTPLYITMYAFDDLAWAVLQSEIEWCNFFKEGGRDWYLYNAESHELDDHDAQQLRNSFRIEEKDEYGIQMQADDFITAYKTALYDCKKLTNKNKTVYQAIYNSMCKIKSRHGNFDLAKRPDGRTVASWYGDRMKFGNHKTHEKFKAHVLDFVEKYRPSINKSLDLNGMLRQYHNLAMSIRDTSMLLSWFVELNKKMVVELPQPFLYAHPFDCIAFFNDMACYSQQLAHDVGQLKRLLPNIRALQNTPSVRHQLGELKLEYLFDNTLFDVLPSVDTIGTIMAPIARSLSAFAGAVSKVDIGGIQSNEFAFGKDVDKTQKFIEHLNQRITQKILKGPETSSTPFKFSNFRKLSTTPRFSRKDCMQDLRDAYMWCIGNTTAKKVRRLRAPAMRALLSTRALFCR